MKELKIDDEHELTIERLLHAKHYALTLDKARCVGCEICKVICPREAIEVKKQPKSVGQKAQRPVFDVSAQKCSYCGMCVPICPFDALRIQVNEKPLLSVVEKESFPQLIHEIEVDSSKCGLDCVECEKACPLNLVKVTLLTSSGEEISRDNVSKYQAGNLKVRVDIDKERSPCCRLCEVNCPKGAIRVRKIFHGVLDVKQERCPEGCQDCLDVCPIPGALYLEGGKVHPDETFCVFCGTCKIVCPVDGALVMERHSVHHTPIKSGAWSTAMEKLTSLTDYAKETQTKRAIKVMQAVEKRTPLAGVENV